MLHEIVWSCLEISCIGINFFFSCVERSVRTSLHTFGSFNFFLLIEEIKLVAFGFRQLRQLIIVLPRCTLNGLLKLPNVCNNIQS